MPGGGGGRSRRVPRGGAPARTAGPPPEKEYSHDGPIRCRKRGYILTEDQSDTRQSEGGAREGKEGVSNC
eukprot:7195100-Pyramimonas_sp.AAC.1